MGLTNAQQAALYNIRKKRRRAALTTYDPDAVAFFARLTNQPTDARKKLYSDLIASLKTAGVWSKLDALYILAAADAQAARQNLVANAFNLVASGSPAFAVDRGYTGDGATSYLDTGANRLTLSKYKQDNAALFARENTDIATDGVVIGAPPSSTRSILSPRSSTNRFLGRVNDTGIDITSASSKGLFAGDRPDATGSVYYRDGTQIGQAPLASVAILTGNFTLLAGNGGTAAFRNTQIGAAGFGASLGATGQASLSSILSTYLAAVGAN